MAQTILATETDRDPFGIALSDDERHEYEAWLDRMDSGRAELEALSDRAREEYERDPWGGGGE